MKFAVDLERCQNHGQCSYSAESVFLLDESGALAFRKDTVGTVYTSDVVDPSLEEDVEEASDVCPARAITLIE